MGLLDWLGILRRIGQLFAPAMGIWHVPGEAALVLVSGWLVGIYGAIASMAVLPLTPEQITILSFLTLTSHNLLVECTVQHRTGTPWWLMLSVRMFSAAFFGWLLALALAHGSAGPSDALLRGPAVAAGPAQLPAQPIPVDLFLLHWAASAGRLTLKIVLILLGLMLATEWMSAHDLYRRLARPLRPLLRALGLSDSVAFLWVTATVLGLAYGSGLIMAEAKEPGRYRPQELRDLNVSIGTCHSLFEDTAILTACGAGLFWITLPRLFVAAIAVRTTRWLAPARGMGG